MIYSKFGKISLSQLGMGTMRLPAVDRFLAPMALSAMADFAGKLR